jgi:ubiquinone/menaquinone biosynthesis C-methylase UbiE
MFTASTLIWSQSVPIIDAEDASEMVRQRLLYDLIGRLVADLLPEGQTLSAQTAVLELACGQGHLAQDLAYASPEWEVAGVDQWPALIALANAQACDQQLLNASFGVVDLTHPPFDFSEASFDLITASFLQRYLQETEFPSLLAECHRLLKPGGWLRLVECEAGWSSSEAINTLSQYYDQAIERAGLRPIPANRAHDLNGKGALRKMLTAAGFEVCAAYRYRLSFSADEEAYASMRQVISVFFELIKPFVLRMQVVSEDRFSDLVRQAVCEIRLPFFEGRWHLLALWGRKSEAPVLFGQAVEASRGTPGGGNDAPTHSR